MLIAMAGLGTPLGAIYILKRYIFPGMSMFMIILLVGGVVLVICLLGFILAKIFGRGKKKRSKRMAADLAADAEGGRVSMDVGAAIKANNEKFFTAIRDMKKGGINIYDLPWYVVIGDSGCGKTRLIEKGGLQFSMGRPEGYQLGTLNYNWWFSEDAIFVDMAGRLCNPQEDEDRREWEAFLGTIVRGRKGFPINAVLACVSAEHLLADPAEKVEQDANTMLERLRDLQSKLGVTFATYLVVTKCDKILGFMQLFDRAERDIRIKNQIVGWSKPGDFNELYDPEQFSLDFDGLYRRLDELRLRRMQDEADEIDLGLAYSFPGEFRQLFAPLQTYIRTLFPLVKNPRAIKNLIFRGVYLTSATQEGALILKHLTERLGAEAAGQFAPLDDLYPNKRPLFIRDLFFDKVFPEKGLVFRNEKQLVRNRKLTKLVKWGSPLIFVVLMGAMVLSWYKFHAYIDIPRADAKLASPQDERTSEQALQLAGALTTDVRNLERGMLWARMLSLGVGADAPKRNITIIQAGLFEEHLLREALVDISKALRTERLGNPGQTQEVRDKAQHYLDALEQYIAWYGCMKADDTPEYLTFENFQKLCGVIEREEAFFAQASVYFNVLRDEESCPNPARLMESEAVSALKTIPLAMRTAHDYLKGYAELSESNPNETISEWMRIHAACKSVEDRYSNMLTTASAERDTLEQWQKFREQFNLDYESFTTAVSALKWKMGDPDAPSRIPSLAEAIEEQRSVWVGYQGRLNEAYAVCGGPQDDAVARQVRALCTGEGDERLAGLDRILWANLENAKLVDHTYKEKYLGELSKYIKEVYKHYPQILDFEKQPEESVDRDVLQASGQVTQVQGILGKLNDTLQELNLDLKGDLGVPSQWNDDMYAIFDRIDEVEDSQDATDAMKGVDPFWQPGKLAQLHSAYDREVARVQGRQLLLSVKQSLEHVGHWGLAEVIPSRDRFDTVKSQYRIPIPRVESDETRKRREPASRKPAKDTTRKRKSRRARWGQGDSRERRPASTPESTAVLQADGIIPKCATPGFLLDRAREYCALLYNLHDFNSNYYLSSHEDDKPLNEACTGLARTAAQSYMSTYVEAWSGAYGDMKLVEITGLVDQADSWEKLCKVLGPAGGGGRSPVNKTADELRPALTEVLASLPFWSYSMGEANEWHSEIDMSQSQWREIAAAMKSAIGDKWPAQLGAFVDDTVLAASDFQDMRRGNLAPWEQMAWAFEQQWKGLAKGIAANATLPRKFDKKTSKGTSEGIPWGGLDQLRRKARLGDEKLTGQFVEFEKHAQKLLSIELTNILWSIQDRYFQHEEPREGWPYRAAEDERLTASRTVEFGKFKSFVSEVVRAQQAFSALEEGLAQDDEHWKARHEFYETCKDWYLFLGIKDRGSAEKLPLKVRFMDPLEEENSGKAGEVQDTAQYYYGAVEMDLGLDIKQDDGQFKEGVLRVPTLREEIVALGSVEAKWKWDPPAGDRELRVRLADGREPRGDSGRKYPSLTKVLGEYSELGICAYLDHYGRRITSDGAVWVTTHVFDLREEFKGKTNAYVPPDKSKVGLSLRFELERPMPKPIRKLEKSD